MPYRVSIDGQKFTTSEGESVFEAATKSQFYLASSCAGKGKCKECIIEICSHPSLLNEKSEEESFLDSNYRLACQCLIKSSAEEIRLKTLKRGQTKACVDFTGKKKKVEIDQKLLQFPGAVYGLAVDLGTTTVAFQLYDLKNGELLSTTSFENPQKIGGTDVLARIHFDTTVKKHLLRKTLIHYMGKMIAELNIASKDIYEVVISANSTMRDLFFGVDVYSLGQMPYKSLVEKQWREGELDHSDIQLSGKESKLPINPEGRVYGLPIIASHVGGDTASCILSVDLANETRNVLLMDIGTNTELVLLFKGKVYVASCPAGPAFEGGGVSCGCSGVSGAIEKVSLNQGVPTYKTIDDQPAMGICGSGLIDLLSELRREELIDQNGRFESGDSEFYLDQDRNIYLSEADIGQLAQAKAANATGIRLLLKHAGANFADLDEFYLAGGFAKHIDIEAAQRIGLIPEIEKSKITQLGNASLEGAAQALLSTDKRKELLTFVDTIEHIELESFEEFFYFFADGVQFSPFDQVEGFF